MFSGGQNYYPRQRTPIPLGGRVSERSVGSHISECLGNVHINPTYGGEGMITASIAMMFLLNSITKKRGFWSTIFHTR